MISRRPSLPTGHTLAGLPPVAKALYSDSKCELYSLHSTGENHTVLFLLWSPEKPPDALRLGKWLALQDTRVLEVVRELAVEECPKNTMGFALNLRGTRIEDSNAKVAEEGSLRILFRSMLDLVERSKSANMYPDFNPSLSWELSGATTCCTLLPLDEQDLSEKEQVGVVAKAFYQFTTGIDFRELKGDAPPLLRWSKYGGEELSRIVNRCLTSTNRKEGINTLNALSVALGAVGENDGTSLVGLNEPATSRSSATGQGLGKVAGMHVLKELLRREVVGPIRNPEPYRRYGLSIPNGILLYGPPGCGKTYIARQLAEELGHYFVEIIPSELASPYVHQSVMKIRELFDAAAEHAPAIIFIDEFEALVPSRSDLGGHQQYKSEEVNEFLAHLNSCSEKNIFIIAATNQPEKIDAAIRRTGRLDKLIYVGPPDEEARREMLALHLEGRPLASDFNIEQLAAKLECYSASDLKFLVDEAARDALKSDEAITHESFRSAMARVNPSISAETERNYQSIEQRGLS